MLLVFGKIFVKRRKEKVKTIVLLNREIKIDPLKRL
jgi:hypothetical protein